MHIIIMHSSYSSQGPNRLRRLEVHYSAYSPPVNLSRIAQEYPIIFLWAYRTANNGVILWPDGTVESVPAAIVDVLETSRFIVITTRMRCGCGCYTAIITPCYNLLSMHPLDALPSLPRDRGSAVDVFVTEKPCSSCCSRTTLGS